jgi:hypothetical protein
LLPEGPRFKTAYTLFFLLKDISEWTNDTLMPSLARTQSSPDGKSASRDLGNQADLEESQPSTWLRAPAPARFVRKQNKEASRTANASSEDMKIDYASNISATIEIDPDIWSFSINRNSTGRVHALSTQSKYYLAHRQHVAGELTKADTASSTQDDACNVTWDGFLRVLSV